MSSSNGAPGAPVEPDFTKFFADMKLPAVPGMDVFVSAQRRNMEVLSAANKVAIEGAQAVARRHMEIMQQTMAELSDTVRSLTTAEPPQEKAQKQAEMLKRSYERAVSNMKELGDLIQKSNAEALGLLNRRFTESIDEVKTLVAKSGPG